MRLGSDYQIGAADDGYNGRVPPRPWRPGLPRAQGAAGLEGRHRLDAGPDCTTAPTPSPMEDDVITDADIARLARTVGHGPARSDDIDIRPAGVGAT